MRFVAFVGLCFFGILCESSLFAGSTRSVSIVARKAAGIPLVTTAFAEAGNQVVSDQHELVGGGAEEHTTEQAVEEAAAHEEAVHQEQATVEGQVHQKTQEEAFHELEAIQHQHQVFLDHEEAEQDQEDTQSQQQPQPQLQMQQQQQQQQQEGDGHVGDGTLSHAEEDQHPQGTPQNAAQLTKAPIPHKEVPQFSESFFVTASVVDDTKDPYQVILRQTFAHDLATNRYAMKAVGLLINGFLEQIIQCHAKNGLGGGFVNVYANSTANLPPKQDQTLYNEYKGEYNEFSNEEEDLIGDKSHEKASKTFVHHEEAGALHCTNSTWNCPMPAPRFWNFPANATYLGPQQVPPPLIMPVALDPDLVEQNPLGGMFEGWEYWIGGERYEVYAVYTAPVWVGKVYSSTGSHLWHMEFSDFKIGAPLADMFKAPSDVICPKSSVKPTDELMNFYRTAYNISTGLSFEGGRLGQRNVGRNADGVPIIYNPML